MAQNQRRTTVIETLGEEIVRIVTPVSICMLLVVILVSVLGSKSSISSASIATVAYSETSSDSSWDKFVGALLNSLAFVAAATVATFVLVILFYFRCTQFLKFYMGLSAFLVLFFLGGETALILIQEISILIDAVTFFVLLFNFAGVGGMAVFMSKMSISVTQSYLVIIGMLVAYWFTLLPEWTTWVLLVSMSLYDLAAVLLPVGPLRLLVELAISRDEDIPALVYEARPVTREDEDMARPNPTGLDFPPPPRFQRFRGDNPNRVPEERIEAPLLAGEGSDSVVTEGLGLGSSGAIRLGLNREPEERIEAPLLAGEGSDSVVIEGLGLGPSGAIKLGLGDFVFYSVLVGRAAMYDYMTVYACYLAIVAGLGVTLVLLAVFQRALPALPVSIMLGVLFYFLTRFLLEGFIVPCSLNLLMF